MAYTVVSALIGSLLFSLTLVPMLSLFLLSVTIFLFIRVTGDPVSLRVEPGASPEDIEITRRLKEVGEVMGVRVLDHVVIGHDRYFSFSDRGML